MEHDRSAAIAAAVLQFRRQRSRLFTAELFAEPAWDLLLDLYVADARGKALTARQVCDRSGFTHSIMSRWLIHLVKIGLVVGDGKGNLDDPLVLSATGHDAMERMMDEAAVLRDKIK